MPGRELPTLTQADVAAHNTSKSCYVTIGTKVYDVTDFLEDHPGGSELILEYGGKDVEAIMKDEASHFHSEAAYEILDDSLIGFVPTEPVIKTAVDSDQPDEVVPLPASAEGNAELREHGVEGELKQRPVFNGGFSKDFYLEQIHRPRHYRGGDSAPLFGNFLEPLSLTPWYVVPSLWLPLVAYGTFTAFNGLSSVSMLAACWVTGVCAWTLIEYCMHRFLFHMDTYLPDNRYALTLHFLLHGIHHYLPMDKYRLVLPPTLFLALVPPFWKLAHTIFFSNWYAAVAAFSGGVFGYVCYDMTHYFLHHRNLPSYYRELKKYHLQHHFAGL